ncbi:MAG: PrsW family intramembrane metalloprotease [Bacilli bacterium]|nr:PrsW family intramembrane metalloprotease [Bacilli bacterium]
MINISFDFNLFNSYYYFYERLLVTLFSLVPALLLVWFILRTDKKSKEPTKNIIICLLSGILTVALAGYLENLVMPYISNNTLLIYVWALIEEVSKIAIFFLFIVDNKHYDDIYDGLVYMTLIALSFAGLENLMYAFSESTVSNSISLALIRDFTTVPLHVICGVVIGFFISLGSFSKIKKKRYLNFSLAVLVPTLIHGTFNLLMNVLGGLKLDSNNSVQVFLFKLMPLVLIMVALFYIVIKFVKKTLELNDTFLNNRKYDKKYSYLMNYEEYAQSEYRKNRMALANKTQFLKKQKKKEES